MSKIKKLLKCPAFNLIELLVVIAIIGVVVVSSVVSYKFLEQKKNESKIESDIRQMQLALELYYNKNHSFPGTPGEEFDLTSDYSLTSQGFVAEGQKAPLLPGEKIYLGSLPESPYVDKPYTYYLHNTSSDSYVIRYQLGDEYVYVTEKLLSSNTTTDPGGVVLGGGDEPLPVGGEEGDDGGGTEVGGGDVKIECTCPCDTKKDPKCVTCDPKDITCFECDPKEAKCIFK